MVVVEPLKLRIENFDEFAHIQSVEVPDFPSDSNCTEKHTVEFDREVYIEADDYREKAEKGFRRLTETQTVGIKYASLVLRFVAKEEVNYKLLRI
jgi:glutaminyl-tRNA synthetase